MRSKALYEAHRRSLYKLARINVKHRETVCAQAPVGFPVIKNCKNIDWYRGFIYNRIARVVIVYKNKMGETPKFINMMWITISYSNI